MSLQIINKNADYNYIPISKKPFSNKHIINFEKTPKYDCINFTGTKAQQLLPEIKVLSGISDEFRSLVTENILKFPKNLLKSIKDNGFKIILSPSLTKGHLSEGVIDPAILKAEAINPQGTLGITYFKENPYKAFIVFADKLEFRNKPEYLSATVNHELSHAVEKINKFTTNIEYKKALQKDLILMKEQNKLHRLTPTEQKLVSHYFTSSKASFPIDEIMADTLAWQCPGGGCYGSGLVLDVENPSLMNYLFPNLAQMMESLL